MQKQYYLNINMENIRTEEIFETDSEKEYEVEKIIRERPKRQKNPKTGKMEYIKEYLVKWVGYESPTWEPEYNLVNSQELLKEFLLKQVMKRLKKEKEKPKTPRTFDIYNNKKFPKSPKKKRKNTESQTEDISTFSYSNSNNIISNKININNININSDNNNNEKIIKEAKDKEKEKEKEKNKEDEIVNMDTYYDIEILDEKKNSEYKNGSYNTIIDISSKGSNICEKETDKDKDTISHKNKDKNKDNQKEEKKSNKKDLNDNQRPKIENNVINAIKEVDNIIDLGKFSESIYSDEENEDEENSKIVNGKIKNKSNEKKNEVLYYLEKKRLNSEKDKDIYEEKDDNLKVIGIYSMKVPNEYEKGIIVNIKFKKNNKIYIEEFNTQSEEIPSDYLVKYYEMFICEFFKGQIYSQELCFD